MIHFYLKHKDIFNLEYIDIGGGFYGPMDENIKRQFPGEIPSIRDYGKVLGQTMAQYFPNSDVKLFVEPGLAMVVNVLDFYCEVEYVKKVGERNIAGVSGSVFNVKPSGHKKDLTAYQISKKPPGGDLYSYIIAGFTCLEHDLLPRTACTGAGNCR
jgi:diaminopimelate decarboxylase